MLGKTAGGLFWMSRYLERSENTARMIETGQRIALTRSVADDDDWSSILQAASVAAGYHAKHDIVSKDQVIDWMLRDRDNGSSVMSSLEVARSNAKLVRTALTHETWEAINSCWMEICAALTRKVAERDLAQMLKLIRQHSALVRGAMHGTMLRNDIYNFARLGTFTERADNTARILDVKYYVLLPSAFAVGSRLDNVQWATILRSVSAEGGYRMTHGNRPRPREIAQFLILDRRMPRSLNFCIGKLRDNLTFLSEDYGTALPSRERATELSRKVTETNIDAVFERGLHEFIQDFLNGLSGLSAQVEIDYRFHK